MQYLACWHTRYGATSQTNAKRCPSTRTERAIQASPEVQVEKHRQSVYAAKVQTEIGCVIGQGPCDKCY